jgi:hypothetical protein
MLDVLDDGDDMSTFRKGSCLNILKVDSKEPSRVFVADITLLTSAYTST